MLLLSTWLSLNVSCVSDVRLDSDGNSLLLFFRILAYDASEYNISVSSRVWIDWKVVLLLAPKAKCFSIKSALWRWGQMTLLCSSRLRWLNYFFGVLPRLFGNSDILHEYFARVCVSEHSCVCRWQLFAVKKCYILIFCFSVWSRREQTQLLRSDCFGYCEQIYYLTSGAWTQTTSQR